MVICCPVGFQLSKNILYVLLRLPKNGESFLPASCVQTSRARVCWCKVLKTFRPASSRSAGMGQCQLQLYSCNPQGCPPGQHSDNIQRKGAAHSKGTLHPSPWDPRQGPLCKGTIKQMWLIF